MILIGHACAVVFELFDHLNINPLRFVFIREIRGCFLISAHQRKSAAEVLAFPNERIKAAAGFKAQAAVEFHSLGIGFSHG